MPSKNNTPVSPYINGPEGNLEILAEGFDDAFNGIAIVCHPHPLHGGTMQNKVVHYIARTLRELGLATLRFNFRGIGNSEGTYAEGSGETDDLLAIIDWCAHHFPETPLWLAGFSFGGYVALRASTQRDIAQLILAAPAVNLFDFKSLASPASPWLLIQGEADEVVPCQDIKDWIETLETPPQTVYLEEVGHFFHGKLNLLRETLKETLQKNI